MPRKVKPLKEPQQIVNSLLALRDACYKEVEGTPIKGKDDILLRINACLYSKYPYEEQKNVDTTRTKSA